MYTAIHTADGITEAPSFTHESTTSERGYLEWELKALDQRFDGGTGLSFDSAGLIERVAVHHRPLGASSRSLRVDGSGTSLAQVRFTEPLKEPEARAENLAALVTRVPDDCSTSESSDPGR